MKNSSAVGRGVFVFLFYYELTVAHSFSSIPLLLTLWAVVAELVDALDSKSSDRKIMRVRFSPTAPASKRKLCSRLMGILVPSNCFEKMRPRSYGNKCIFFAIS